MNLLEDCETQTRAVADFFDALGVQMDRLPKAALLTGDNRNHNDNDNDNDSDSETMDHEKTRPNPLARLEKTA